MDFLIARIAGTVFRRSSHPISQHGKKEGASRRMPPTYWVPLLALLGPSQCLPQRL